MTVNAAVEIDLLPAVDRFGRNLARIHNLMGVYRTMTGAGRGRSSVFATDLLRSAVVLLHATLEDFLRSLSRAFLPGAAPEVLDTIPLLGFDRSERFLLGRLVRFRGRTVDEVIEDSIESYLERSNYNSATEIAGLLRNLGLDPKLVAEYFPEIDRMIQRRHQIVHRADCTAATGRGHHHAQSLPVLDVERWATAVLNFHNSVVTHFRET